MSAVKDEARPYLDAFRETAGEPPWLREARRAALEAFGARGFPTRREEAWKFTRLGSLAETFFAPPRRKQGSATGGDTGLRRHDAAAIKDAHRLVIANGIVQSAPPDLPNGVWLASMARTIVERPELARRAFDPSDVAGGQPFASLNAALFADGFVLALEEGVALDRPVEIVHLGDAATPCSIHARSLIALAPRSRAVVIERYIGDGGYWTNAVTGVALGAGAALTQLKLQEESPTAIHFGLVRAALADASRYRSFSLTLGADLSRHEILTTLGDGAEANIAGAYLLRGGQDATTAVFVDHAAPNATTREIWKGVVEDRAHGAFLGSILVREGAQKTDAKQVSRALLLSDRASVDTKPELRILADDVKCAHGAAVGDLDRDMLFYLRARGIGLDEARHMLIEAFVLEAIEEVEDAALRDHLAGRVRHWLGREAA